MGPIDQIYTESKSTITYLFEKGELSLGASTERDLKKVFLMATASFFEEKIKEALKDFVLVRSNNNVTLSSFVSNKAIARQYHTYFNWDGTNINQFLGFFGPSFKDKVSNVIREDEALADSIKAFIEIGQLRNRLTHQNFAVFPLDKTLDELYVSYQKALMFVNVLPLWFEKHC